MNRDLQTLVLMCGCALSVVLLTLAVVLPTPHDIVVPFKEGTVPGLQPQGGRKDSHPLKHPGEIIGHWATHVHSHTADSALHALLATWEVVVGEQQTSDSKLLVCIATTAAHNK